jgi:hypothetical protein
MSNPRGAKSANEVGNRIGSSPPDDGDTGDTGSGMSEPWRWRQSVEVRTGGGPDAEQFVYGVLVRVDERRGWKKWILG